MWCVQGVHCFLNITRRIVVLFCTTVNIIYFCEQLRRIIYHMKPWKVAHIFENQFNFINRLYITYGLSWISLGSVELD